MATLSGIGSVASGLGSLAGAFGGGDEVSLKGVDQAKEKTFQGTILTPTFRLGEGILTRSVGGQFTREADAGSRIRGINTGGLGATFGGTRSDILARREGLSAGFGRLSRSSRDILRDAEAAAAGNLRQQLSQRNVLGSSFGNAQESQLRAEFARESAAVEAEAFQLEEQAFVENVGAELGLNDQEIAEVNAEIAVASEEADLANQIADRELSELGIAVDAAARISQRVDDVAFMDAVSDIAETTVFTEEGPIQLSDLTRQETVETVTPLDPDRPKTKKERDKRKEEASRGTVEEAFEGFRNRPSDGRR